MGFVNRMMTAAFDVALWPFRTLDPLWGLAAVSLVAGVFMLWIFGRTSDQGAILLIRDKIRGNLIGIRLFGDDLGMLFRLQGRIFRQTLTYMRYALFPMVVMLVPVLLILAQLNLRYGPAPLPPGEAAVVKLTLDDAVTTDREFRLEAPPGVVVETPGVRIPARREVAWRVRAERPGDYELTIHAGDETVVKRLVAGEHWGVTPALRSASWLDLLLYPGEAPIPARSGVERIEIGYPALSLSLFGFGVNWLLFFFVASIAFGFAFRRPLGVEI
jgi:hypothetical protein